MTKLYRNAFAEVYEIIGYLKDEDYYKIPKEVIKAIDENRDKDYEFMLDESLPLEDQEMLPETKAILFNIFKDCFATEEKKQKISNYFTGYEYKKELEKKEKHNSDEIFKNKNSNNIKKNEELFLMEKTKENWVKKIINNIKSFFVKKEGKQK